MAGMKENERLRAIMDPWALVALVDGESLYGFVIEHAGTGGLSWVLSTPVVWLDPEAGQARTRSGRRYELGRRIEISDLPDEEARLAFAFLARPYLRDPSRIPPPPDPVTAMAWLTARKMARHLGLEPPPLKQEAAIKDFMTRNMRRYVEYRRSGQRFS
jgi:hypothetical protein